MNIRAVSAALSRLFGKPILTVVTTATPQIRDGKSAMKVS
jgi:hypothetical protein